ncbi:MAG TPA: glycosyltransferase family 39 protein [Acidimicrobiales bacterium]
MSDVVPEPAATRRASKAVLVAIAAIALAAFAFRVWVVAEVATREPNGGDPLYYHLQANLLVDGHGFAEPFGWAEHGTVEPSAIHPPGFTVWLASASLAGFDSVFAHKAMSALAGALAVAVVGLIAARLASGRAGVLAALVAAVHPNFWVVDGALMPEALYALGVACVLLFAYRAASLPSRARLALAGVSIGLAALVRGEALLFALLLGSWLAARSCASDGRVPPIRRARVRCVVAHGAVVVGAAAAVMAPWTVRNLVTFDAPVLVSANADEVLRNANCDDTWGGRLLGFWSVYCYQPAPPPHLDEAERARFWRRAGLDYVADNARRLPVVLAARVGRVWGVYRPSQNVDLSSVEGRDIGVARAGHVAYAFAWVPAIAGVVALRRRRVPLWPLASTAVVVTATAMYAYGVIRFRMPAEVALAVLVGVGIDSVCARFSGAATRT